MTAADRDDAPPPDPYRVWNAYFGGVHPEGLPFVGGAAALTLVLVLIHGPLGWIGAALTLAIAAFFRNPERMTPTRAGLVIAPADGQVVAIRPAVPPEEMALGEAPLTRISIFLSILDVHVNRIPVDGTVVRTDYHSGRFLNASLDKASEQNERNALVIATPQGGMIGVVQIAGLVARRIRCWVRPEQVVRAGERFGLIRFGSRTDIYLPPGVAPQVATGQWCIGGETVLADLLSQEPPRDAQRR